MSDSKIIIDATPNFLSLKNYIYEGVHSATFGVVEKKDNKSILIHYESTNKKWSKFYANSAESKECHIVKYSGERSLDTNEFTIIWELLIPDNEASVILNDKRRDLEHCNGVTICRNISSDLLLCATFTGHENDINFAGKFLQRKQEFLNRLFGKK